MTQAPSGFSVIPAMWTRRLATSTKKSTWIRLIATVTTVKKSQAIMLAV